MSIRRVLGIASLLCLSGCLLGGGTGTDTENGIAARVTDSLGAPLAGVALKLYDPAYRPDSGRAPADPVAEAKGPLVSDGQGYTHFKLKAAGKFVVEGISPQGNTLFFDTLAVSDLQQKASYTFRARASKAFHGKVRLASGMRIDSGRVFIRGTGRMCRVDSAGGYDLGLLPADIERMALGARLTSSPVSVLKAIPVKPTGMDSVNKSGYACTTVSADSAGKLVSPTRSGTQSDAAPWLDTAHVDTALKSCGDLQPGSVVNYTTNAAPVISMGGAPLTVNLLVLKGADSTGYTSPKTTDPVLVPLSQCVAAPGKESTTFAVDVSGTSGANDLIVGDVAGSCLGP